ncbi:ATP-binding protein [Lentiprolixibacter aurantiacus]|uniref:histidine kinase n=1 Tax=Lentiprolixibacter aurantiacus TaxID=2993939 RepID=A0AAE3SNI7_9FLAO|nr:ATP-binding protein [Lentiprolixibacter aurantiacus]MCX2719580.1 ATP-binding protein [Lentiprolixibacter aurantiacus]
MDSKKLLSKLTDIEAYLDDFSYEELSVAAASELKKSFESFKKQLEGSLWEEPQGSLPESSKKTSSDRTEEMLIATVSHEIRTPLSGIIGFTDLLRESDLNEEQRYQVNAIQSASNALMDIINELLEYSKLSAGLELFEEVDFNFYSIIQDVSYLCKTLMLGKDVELDVDLDPDIPIDLLGDPSKLTQVLLNLLGNSIKFVEKGKILLKVKCLQDGRNDVLLQFEIADTGIGISENDLKHIFNSFKQANQHTFSKYGGTGLGLSIVKQIIQKLGGEIQVRSQLGKGTTFTFSIPYRKGKATNKNIDGGMILSPEKVKGMRILIFEDNPMNQRLIEQRLQSWGCRAYITENASYGLRILETKVVDMVLMDLRMPLMNGFEITRIIREHKSEAIRSLPVIALTADFTAEDKVECDQEGINDYILKPYTPEELLQKIIINKKAEQRTSAVILEPNCNQVKSTAENFDLGQVLNRECMGDIGMLEELIALYHKNALEFIGKVRLHLKGENYEQIAFAAHKIKCGLKMLKTYQLCTLVEELYDLAKQQRNPGRMNDLYDKFVMTYTQVETKLNEALEELKSGR